MTADTSSIACIAKATQKMIKCNAQSDKKCMQRFKDFSMKFMENHFSNKDLNNDEIFE